MTEAPGTEPIEVLMIDGKPGEARLIETWLANVDRGFEISYAGGLGEALDELELADFDAILLELSRADSSGLETVEQLCTAFPHTPVVILSDRDDEEMAVQALQGGAEDYLVKGWVEGDLLARAIRYAITRKKAEEKLTYLALYDPLTGAANRALFHDRLEQALARAARSGDAVAVLFLDLDRFKAVNDTLGHAGGDALLQEVARRIEGRVRRTDTVARLGGDEFAIILEGLSDAQNAARVARDVLKCLSEPLVLYGHETIVSASLGIAVRPPSEGTRLLMEADAAMYRAKRNGGGDCQFYSEEMNDRGG
jgi:diguanylate cyclase (GGDEF)-like protein